MSRFCSNDLIFNCVDIKAQLIASVKKLQKDINFRTGDTINR